MTRHLTSFGGGDVELGKYLKQDSPPAAAAGGPAAADWRDLLGQVIQREILPRLQQTKRDPLNDWEAMTQNGIDATAIGAFVALVIADDVEQLHAVADRVILYTGGRDALLNELLAPAARLLGQMWEEDACDFMAVTLGIHRLNQIMKQAEAASEEPAFSSSFDRHILLLPAPGEQHDFGIAMVADGFRAAGWCVRSAPSVSRTQLLRMVKDEWFDVVGLSVSSDRFLNGLPACIRAVRSASRNRRSLLMLGGYAINYHAERTRFLGADCVAENAAKAVQLANNFMETAVTERFCQFITKPIDAGRAL